jgi:nucleotide-binding universal stress UspA family protein
MFSLARTLLPVDYSERSLGRARYAIPLAEHFKSELTLLRVLEPHYEMGTDTNAARPLRDLLAAWRQDVERRANAILSAEVHCLPVNRIVLERDPAQQIVEFAGSKKCDLIMMASKGRGPFRRLLLGSTTAKVLHDAACPVWTGVHTVSAPSVDSTSFGRVLCAIDLDPHSVKTLDWASRFASEFKPRLLVVHILPRLYSPGEGYFSRGWRSRAIDQAEKEVERVQRNVGHKGEVKLEAGDVPKTVCSVAKRTRADLLIVGRGNKRGASGRLPSTAYAIIREAICPVVSV